MKQKLIIGTVALALSLGQLAQAVEANNEGVLTEDNGTTRQDGSRHDRLPFVH